MRRTGCALGLAALFLVRAAGSAGTAAAEVARSVAGAASTRVPAVVPDAGPPQSGTPPAAPGAPAPGAQAEVDGTPRGPARRAASVPFPDLRGRLVFHRYSSYEARDGKLFMLDLSDRSLTEPSAAWPIEHIINPHISPDGARVVFGGDDTAIPAHDHDIYLWEVGSPEPPTNLTNQNDRREEDAKFSADGTRIVFKERRWDAAREDFVFDIKTMALDGSNILPVTDDVEEDSMPSLTPDGQRVVYARGVGADSDIYVVNTNGTDGRPVAHEPDLQEYYPIAWENDSFLYARWFSATNHSDQTYVGFFNGDPPVRLPFNEEHANFSDHAPGETPYLFVSSTRAGGEGGYDRYLADTVTGTLWSLREINPEVNTPLHELGAAYAVAGSGPVTAVLPSGSPDGHGKRGPLQGPASAGGTFAEAGGPEDRRLRSVLHPNAPNPFNASTRIRFEIPHSSTVSLRVFDTLGREVRRLVDAELPAGSHGCNWDGRDARGEDLGTGLYFLWLRVRMADGTLYDAMRRMVVLK